jgi:hypothetical protein
MEIRFLGDASSVRARPNRQLPENKIGANHGTKPSLEQLVDSLLFRDVAKSHAKAQSRQEWLLALRHGAFT